MEFNDDFMGFRDNIYLKPLQSFIRNFEEFPAFFLKNK